MGKMSKSSSKGQPAPKIVYPAGCKDIDEELGKDELVKRLKVRNKAIHFSVWPRHWKNVSHPYQ